MYVYNTKTTKPQLKAMLDEANVIINELHDRIDVLEQEAQGDEHLAAKLSAEIDKRDRELDTFRARSACREQAAAAPHAPDTKWDEYFVRNTRKMCRSGGVEYVNAMCRANVEPTLEQVRRDLLPSAKRIQFRTDSSGFKWAKIS